MQHSSIRPAGWLLALGLLLLPTGTLPAAQADPLDADSPAAYVYRKGDQIVYYRSKIFTEAGPRLIAPIILRVAGETVSIMVAPSAQVNLSEIVLENGTEYLFNADGKLEREAAFPTLSLNNTLGTESPGTFVEGRALVESEGVFPVCTIEEDRYGVRTITLATNKWQDPRANSLHLFNGYRLSFGESSKLESQMSFGEYAINGKLTAPGEVWVNPQGTSPAGPGGQYGPQLPPGVYINGAGIYVDAAGNPIGRPTEVPKDSLPTPKTYSRPAIKVVGIIPFQYEGKLGADNNPRSNASPELYAGMATESMLNALSKVKDIEVKILELAPEDQSGTYLLAFAKKIGQKYGCDAIVTGTVTTLETGGDTRLDTQTKLIGKVEAALIDTTGGKFNWKNTGEQQRFVAKSTFASNSSASIRDLFSNIFGDMASDMRSKKVFEAKDI
ncbi:MAG: hypothetical protein GEEBNDBF_01027 [bacterium]|nr:hypothetical protein [bacterium]